MLTKKDIDFYNENGFITVDKVISDNEIFDLKKNYRWVCWKI